MKKLIKSPVRTVFTLVLFMVAAVIFPSQGKASSEQAAGLTERTSLLPARTGDQENDKSEFFADYADKERGALWQLLRGEADTIEKTSSWEVISSTDQMSGKTSKFIISYSNNILKGWLRDGRVLVGYTCGGGIYLRANDLGFQIDDIDCGSYSCSRLQYVRVKFDDEPPERIRFSVWEKNNDGMSLIKESPYRSGRNDEEFLIQEMKASNTMLIEVALFGTKGREQIATFDLKGFTIAFDQCNN